MTDVRWGLASWGNTVVAGLAALVALAIVLVLATPPDANILLFIGGWRGGIFGAATLLFLPLIIAVQFALGVALARALGRRDGTEEPWLYWISGSAVMSLVGVGAAIAGGLNPWVCGTLFIFGVAYAFGPVQKTLLHALKQVHEWFWLTDIAGERLAFGIVRVGIIIALALIVLRAAVGELNETDFVQFYWGWFNEVRHLGGIWLSPERPLIQEFAVGRGNGTYLLIAGMAPGLVVPVVSAGYCILFATILRSFVLKALAGLEPRSGPLGLFAADVSCLASLWMLPAAVSLGKYHLQFAAWALGLLLGALLADSLDETTARLRCYLLVPLAIAIPIGLAQFELFAVLAIGIAMMAAKTRHSARRLVLLVVVGIASAGVSLLANWLYLGIPDLNPFPLFQKFIIASRFELWTSRLQQYYLNYIQAGALTFYGDDGVGAVRELRSLLEGLWHNRVALLCGAACIAIAVVLSWRSRVRGVWAGWTIALLGLLLGFALYQVSGAVFLPEVATKPIVNQLIGCGVAVAAYLLVVIRSRAGRTAPRFALSLLGYWVIGEAFVLLLHSGSLERFMRHADAVAVSLLLVGLVYVKVRIRRVPIPSSAIVVLLLTSGFLFSFRAGVSAAKVDSPSHLFNSTFGLRGRAAGLTHPMARIDRCGEIAASVPANARALFLNAYTAMAYCNNAALLPRTMIVPPHGSDYARDIASSAFAGADRVVETLRRLHIDYFLVLKGDSEFWMSGFSAPFRPDEIARRFDLWADTPSFYVLSWRGSARPIPTEVLSAITEWRRIGIQQHGFIWNNEFVGQWRAMANLGADRPKYAFGSVLDFTSGGWSALYADHGWYAAEPAGTWTLGPLAILTLPFERPADGTLDATVELTPFLVPQLPSRVVRVKIDDRVVATWTLKLGEGRQVRKMELPAGLVANKAQIVLSFEIENAVSPYALYISSDWRPVGIMVHSLTVQELQSGH